MLSLLLTVLFVLAQLSVGWIFPFMHQTKMRKGLFVVEKPFDFSSVAGWDAFYQQTDEVVEWHSSVGLDELITYIPHGSNCLVLGCGNSKLPGLIYDTHHGITSVTCVDSSQSCINDLRETYGRTNKNMAFVCGDATKLSECVKHNVTDVIVDKGLVDALMCGEGWDTTVGKVFEESSRILSPNGIYLLVSYRLSSSTKEFLTECGQQVGLDWSFDLTQSNAGVSVSVARQRSTA